MNATGDSPSLLFEAFDKFVAAGFHPSAAKHGIRGTWVGSPAGFTGTCKAPEQTDDLLERARRSAAAWALSFGSLPNPYLDVCAFFSTGAILGRWENNILDIYFPCGKRLGVPLATFTGRNA